MRLRPYGSLSLPEFMRKSNVSCQTGAASSLKFWQEALRIALGYKKVTHILAAYNVHWAYKFGYRVGGLENSGMENRYPKR